MADDNSLNKVVQSQSRRSRWAGSFVLLLDRLEIDRAVIFLVLARVCQMLAFPITIVLIAQCLTPELQGFYYTFASLLALQVFVELGFVLVIINTASHEWSCLGLDKAGHIVGEPEALSRLVSLGRLIFKWYAVASAVFIVAAGFLGYVFFSQTPHPGIQWQAPWLTLVCINGLLLLTLPFNALLEGCNQVVTINKFRVSQTLLESLALWGILLLGGELWAVVAAISVKLLWNLYLLLVKYWHFFTPFFKPPLGFRINWKTEIWPMQWRLAMAGLVTYFTYSLFNPVMFQYHGATVAGQMGMTLQIVNGVQIIAMAWVTTKVPKYGMFIARREYEALDRLWLRSSTVSLAVVSAGTVVTWLVVYGLNIFKIPLSERLLSPFPTALFLLAAILLQVEQFFVTYLRAHKQEPILGPNVTTSLATGLLVWMLGSRFGPIGAAIGYLSQKLASLIWITIIWWRCRADWHKY